MEYSNISGANLALFGLFFSIIYTANEKGKSYLCSGLESCWKKKTKKGYFDNEVFKMENFYCKKQIEVFRNNNFQQ